MITLESVALTVTVNPRCGGAITAVTDKASGLGVMGRVPWDPVAEPISRFAARDEAEWLTRYTGGWPPLFPNGGDACTHAGVFHGFHGEASISPFEAEVERDAVRLVRRLFTIPVTMERRIAVAGDVVTVSETITHEGQAPLEVMWGQHPTFGGDLLAGDVEISTNCADVSADDAYDPPANPLVPGAHGAWPSIAGRSGPSDLAHPKAPISAVAYLQSAAKPWAAIRRLDNAIAARLDWERQAYPCAWLWYELGGDAQAPWHGRARLIGIEPNSTWPGAGLASAKSRGGRLMTLSPGTRAHTALTLRVFEPAGPIEDQDLPP